LGYAVSTFHLDDQWRGMKYEHFYASVEALHNLDARNLLEFDDLINFSKSESVAMLEALIERPNVPRPVLYNICTNPRSVWYSGDLAIKALQLLDEKTLTEEELTTLSNSKSEEVVKRVIRHPKTPKDVLISFAKGQEMAEEAYERIDKNTLTEYELTMLSNSKSEKVILKVIEHPRVPREVLMDHAMGNKFAQKAFQRLSAIFLSQNEISQLAQSKSDFVRKKAKILMYSDQIAKSLGMTDKLDKLRSFLIRIDDEGGEAAIDQLDGLVKAGIIQNYGIDGIDRLKQISGKSTRHLLKAFNILAEHDLLLNLRSIPSSFNAQRKEVQGHFNEKDPIHLLINYFDAIQQMSSSSGKTPEFEEYLSMVKAGDSGASIKADVPKGVRLELRGVVYEAYLLRKKILEIYSRAKELGRNVLVVANKSYGEVAISPITERSTSGKVIRGTNIPVISTKIGSTECHNNEFMLYPDLFSGQTMKNIMEKNPIVIVVDASTSVSDPHRTSPHIPDAFKGYRNYFMAINNAVSGKIVPENFGEDKKFENGLINEPNFGKFKGHARHAGAKPEKAEPYSLHFWHPGNKQLYLRVNKQKDTKAVKMLSAAEIKGPAVIFMQSAMEPEALPDNIRNGFMHGKRHTAAYFDDKDNFRQFYMGYRKGYGIVRHQKMSSLAKFYYRELMEMLGEKIQKVEVKPLKINVIKHIVTDLDGVIAMTDEPIPATIFASLVEFLKKGGNLYLATEDIEMNVEKRVAQPFPAELRKNITIFSDGATKAFTFDKSGRKQPIDEYSNKSIIDNTMKQNICNILNTDLIGQFEFDARPDRISPEVRIDLRNVKKPRNDFIDKLRSLLFQSGIKAKVYKAGKTSVKVVLQHKEDAVRYLAQKGMISPSETIVLGDNARQNQIDRGLLTALPEAISINIGHRSSSIEKENPNAVQLADEGINATLNILSSVNKYGGVDKDNLNR